MERRGAECFYISTTNYVASVGVTVGVISLKGMALCFLDP